MSEAELRNAKRPFGGYEVVRSARVDIELTHTDKGTPCGEYLRRFWQPVALVSDLSDVPFALRIFGEDLVIFRDKAGKIGLLSAHCSHRGTSLEFGLIVENGIRCAYHGWHYGIDGQILEVPSEERPGTVARRMFHGAYPTHELKGMVFAYMGPPDEKPPFPVYDFMVADGEECVPYRWPVPCNWLQVRENTQDPIHLTFLHSMFSIKQFGDLTADIPYIRAYPTPIGQITTSVRRIDDLFYGRVNEMILPNLARLADTLTLGAAIPANKSGDPRTFDQDKKLKYKRQIPSSHGLGLTMWVVPNDNETSMFMGWHHLPLDEDQGQREQRITSVTFGQLNDRPYEERQRNPGDHDVLVSAGVNVSRDNDNLTPADAGVALYRKQLREGIAAVSARRAPKGMLGGEVSTIPTYAYSLLRDAPPRGSDAEEFEKKTAFEREIAEQILNGLVPMTPRILELA